MIAQLEVEMRDRIVEAAISFVGTPFSHQGRCRAGTDCAGLVVLTCDALGIPREDCKAYDRNSAGVRMPETLARFCHRISIVEAKKGDLFTFWRSAREREEHIAWWDPPGHIIQAWIKGPVERVHFDGRWRERRIGAWRLDIFKDAA